MEDVDGPRVARHVGVAAFIVNNNPKQWSGAAIVSHIRRLMLWPRGFVRIKSMMLPFMRSPSRSRIDPTSADLKCRTRASPSSGGRGPTHRDRIRNPHDVKEPGE